QVVWGTPARPLKEHLELLANLGRLPQLREEVMALKRRLEELAEKVGEDRSRDAKPSVHRERGPGPNTGKANCLPGSGYPDPSGVLTRLHLQKVYRVQGEGWGHFGARLPERHHEGSRWQAFGEFSGGLLRNRYRELAYTTGFGLSPIAAGV
ncbi:MAG: hypothetical protein ABFD89_13685, partial [Bryobacteraceae bacterium]